METLEPDIGPENAAILRERTKKSESRPKSKGNIVLACLIASDCEIRRSSRIGGPRGVRSALGDRSDDIPSNDELLAFAIDHQEAVRRIADGTIRMIVSLAMATVEGCKPAHRQRDIERITGIPRSTLRRLLKCGLDLVAVELSHFYEGRRAA